MAYETTEVSVAKSQEGIRRLIMSRKGSRIAFISDPPREGFQAVVLIQNSPYTIRIFGEMKEPPTSQPARYGNRNLGYNRAIKESAQNKLREAEERRIWRVLFYHLKSVFEAADSGVMEFRELMLPYIVTTSGKTIGEQILPVLDKAIESNPARLLGA
jgi:hypothetical protein